MVFVWVLYEETGEYSEYSMGIKGERFRSEEKRGG